MMKGLIVFVYLGIVNANGYDSKLTKLWSMTGSANSGRSSVVNVTSASVVIQPSSYSGDTRSINTRYAFKPRAIPIQPNYYENEYKSEVLFPGNLYPIAKEKSVTSDASYNPLASGPYKTQPIPLIRSQEYARSLDEEDEPIIEKPEGFSEPTVQRRSLSYILGVDEADDRDDDDLDEFEEDDEEYSKSKGPTKYKPKPKKLKKYMLPLLLAYKMKYFALVPVMIGGLILLVGATGLAGFFFALFAAVMGLQKGGGY